LAYPLLVTIFSRVHLGFDVLAAFMETGIRFV
jgi:hypothetical protein